MIYFSDFGPGGGGGGSWTPMSLADLAAWYDADQQTEAADAAVSTLVDRSGNGFNMAAGSFQPLLRHSYVNGKKAIDTLGGRAVSHANTLLPNGSITACAAFWVAKGFADPMTGNDWAPLNNFGTGGTSHYWGDGNWYETFGTNNRRSVNPPTSWANWHLAGVTSASNDFKMWWNGTAIVTSGTNTVATGTGTRTVGDAFNGHYAELILMDALPSSTDREKIEGYLAHKYGFQSDLPGGHPYLSSPP